MTHICVGKLTIIGSDNGLSPERRQAIIWTNAGILLIGPLGTNFSEILIEILIEEYMFENFVCEMLFISSRPHCVNVVPEGAYFDDLMQKRRHSSALAMEWRLFCV